MLVWIDGPFGVGKTSVGLEIQKQLPVGAAELLDADDYYQNKFDEDTMKAMLSKGKGCFPQNNLVFIEKFKQVIAQAISGACISIVVMALTEKECKELLFDALSHNGIDIRHVILTASNDVLTSRITSDNCRPAKNMALNNMARSMAFLEHYFEDALWIDTTNLAIPDVAKTIIKSLFSSQ